MADSNHDNQGTLTSPAHRPVRRTSERAPHEVLTLERTALWHFLQAMMLTLNDDKALKDQWWEILLRICRHDATNFAQVFRFVSHFYPFNGALRQLYLVWSLSSSATRLVFASEAKAWLCAFAAPPVGPVDRPDFQLPPPIKGNVEGAAFVASLVMGSLRHVALSKRKPVARLAASWIEMAVSDDASAGQCFDQLCKTAARVVVGASPDEEKIDRHKFPSTDGIPPEWFSRYRHAFLKQEFLTSRDDLDAAREIVDAPPMKIERCETRQLTKTEIRTLVALTSHQFSLVEKFLRNAQVAAEAQASSVAAPAAPSGSAHVSAVAAGSHSHTLARRRFTAKLKAEVALAALARPGSISSLATQHGVPPLMVHDWQSVVVQEASSLFVSAQRSKVPRNRTGDRALKN